LFLSLGGAGNKKSLKHAANKMLSIYN